MAEYNSALLCRICLVDGATIPIFGADNNGIHSKLCLCLNETIENKQGYPKNICNLCQSTLNIVYNFIKKFHHSCQVLEESLGTVIKEEQIKVELIEEPNLATTDYDCVQDITTLESFKGNTENEKLENECNINKSFASSDEGDFIWKEQVQCTNNSSKTSNKGNKRKITIRKNDSQAALDKKSTRKIVTQKKVSQSGSDNKRIRRKVVRKQDQPTDLKKARKKNMPMVPPAQNLDQPPDPIQLLCDICGTVFNHPDKLKWHRDVVHLKTGTTTCSICHKVLATSHGLKRHMSRAHLIVTERTFRCDKCSKTFLTEEYLRSHLRIHSNTKRRRDYFCKFCDKKLANTMALLIHERSVHTGERPAVCSICEKSFFHELYLTEHMRLHTGERPFKCPICERGYAQRGNMKSHLRNHKISDLAPELLSKLKPSYLKHLKP